MKQLAFFFCIIFFSAHILDAQIFPYRQYSSDGELANSNVYAMVQDTEGYIWFATDNGLSRFDGSKSNNYGISNGLPVNAILSVAIDQEGNIYAGAKRKGIYQFSNTKFKQVVDDTSSVLSNHTIIAGKEFFYSLRRMYKITAIHVKDNTATEISFPENIKPVCMFQDAAGNVYAGTTAGLYKVENTTAKKIQIAAFNEKKIQYITGKNDQLHIATGNEIYLVKDTEAEKKINITELPGETIQNFLFDQYDNLWFSTTSNNRFYVHTNSELIRLDETLHLQGAAVNSLMHDNEGNVWAATFGKGVFCFHNMYCTNFSEQQGLTVPYITSLETGSKGDVFVGTTNGLFYFDGKNFTHRKQNTDAQEHIAQMYLSGNTLFVSRAIGENTHIRDGINNTYNIEYKNASTYSVMADGTAVSGKWNNRIYLTQNGKTDSVLLSTNLRSNKVTAIYETQQGEILCGTNNGLFKLDAAGNVTKFSQKEFNTTIHCITPEKNGNLWIGTLTGIVVMKNDSVQFTWTPGIKDIVTVTSIVFDNKNRAWAGTLTGMYLIPDAKNNILFDSKTCLLNDEVSSLAYDAEKNIVWVGTNGGLSRIDVSKFDALQTFKPVAIFKNIRTQDATTRISSDTTLPYNRNNFTVRFSAIHFTNPAGVKFLFRLDKANLQQVAGRQVELAGLPYGKHTITIVAENDRGERGDENSISITIQTPFWATWWFKTLIGLTILSIAFLLIRWRFLYEKRKQKEQLELQNKISELRHQALNASMNPHFIFNSLNSIQQFINTHNTEEASEYLGKFARLIRLQLNNGNKTFITLEEELDRLHRYLELEKIRFGKKLNYSIRLHDKIDAKNTYLPNMILQPFVENALWHGILPMNQDGNIAIDFSKQNGFLKVLIDDDGIGIRESENRKKDSHRSLGMQMILERIQLLKKLDGNDIMIDVKDKSELGENLHGTRVQIRITTNGYPIGSLLP